MSIYIPGRLPKHWPLNFYPGMFAFRGQKSLDLCGFPGAVERGPIYFTLGGLKTASKA